MNRRIIRVLLLAMICLVAVAPAIASGSPFATEVVEHSADLDGSGTYNDPQAVLGQPATWNGDCCCVSMVCSAWGTDQGGSKVITTIGSNSYIIVKFDHHVEDDPNNPYGIDFLVFGNSFYGGSGAVDCNTDMETYYLMGGPFEEPVLVAVSQDGKNWYEYSSGPYGDTAKYPTQAREWDRVNHQWGELLDFTKPVEPGIFPFNDCDPGGAPKYVADVIDYCYKGSAGGTGFDLAPSGYPWIQYIKVYGDASHSGGEIDAFADVSPSSLPDLIITEKSEEWVSLVDKTYNITYTVKNLESLSANASNTGIYIDGVLNTTVSCSALAPYANETKTAGPFTMSGANDTIRLCADNDDVVAESDEGNNCMENVFKTYPDLTVTEITTPTHIYVNTSNPINVKVENIGADAASFNVTLKANESLIDVKTVSSLASGKSTTVEFEWTPEALGNYTLKVKADSNNEINESDELNNEKTKDVTVENKNETTVVTYFRVEGRNGTEDEFIEKGGDYKTLYADYVTVPKECNVTTVTGNTWHLYVNETNWYRAVCTAGSREGDVFWEYEGFNKTIGATCVLCALQKASEQGNFTYNVTDVFWTFFVEAIEGQGCGGAWGWCYKVWNPDDVLHPGYGAAEFLLGYPKTDLPPPHEQVLWHWCASGDFFPLKVAVDKTNVAAGEDFTATVSYSKYESDSGWFPDAGATIYIGTETFTTGDNGTVKFFMESDGSYPLKAKKSAGSIVYIDSDNRTTVNVSGSTDATWWTQTNKSDFASGTHNRVDTSVILGNILLEQGGPMTEDYVLDGETATLGGEHFFNNFTLINGATLNVPPSEILRVHANYIEIDSTSSIDATGKGYSGGAGGAEDGNDGKGGGVGCFGVHSSTYGGGGGGAAHGGDGRYGGDSQCDPKAEGGAGLDAYGKSCRYGDDTFYKGSGGGGGAGTGIDAGGDGGYGGGAVVLEGMSMENEITLVIKGNITAEGGNGTDGEGCGCGGGGGGSGGTILIKGKNMFIANGTLSVKGGAGGDMGGTSGCCAGGGGPGAGGHIKVFFESIVNYSGGHNCLGGKYGEGEYSGGGARDGFKGTGAESEYWYNYTANGETYSPILPFWSSGNFTSTAYDTGYSADFKKIYWCTATPPNTSVKFQIATNNDSSTWDFKGPDGASSTYYEASGTEIWSGHDGHRYIKYKAFLNTTAVEKTPTVSKVGITYKEEVPDSIPPASITDLTNVTYEQTYINWTWTDPVNADFSRVMVYLNGIFKTNVTKGVQFYNASGLDPDTSYEIGTRTVDISGNINQTWVNHTAWTAPSTAVAIDDKANADIPVKGTVSGTYKNTHASDNVYEAIEEVESKGKPANRYSTLEHKWLINVTGGNKTSVTFHLEANCTNTGDGDEFKFEYSTDENTDYEYMVTVNTTTDTNLSCELLSNLTGTVYIRVTDTNQTAGNRSLDTISIGHMFIRSVLGVEDTTPPAKVTGVSVTTVSCIQLNVSWNANNESDLDHYNVYRNETSGFVHVASPTTNSYLDTELTASTTYYYKITAVDDSGNEGEASEQAQGTTAADTFGPVTSDVVASPNPTNGAATVTLTATISDTSTCNSIIAAAEYFVNAIGDNGTGTAMNASDGAFDAVTEAVTAEIDVSGWSVGNYTLYVHGKDVAGNWGETSVVVLEVTEAATDQMHVQSINMSLSNRTAGKNVFTHATALVTIVNIATGALIEGATVEGHWSNATDNINSGITNLTGQVSLDSDEVKNAPPGTNFTFTVDSVTNGLEWDGEKKSGTIIVPAS